MRRETCRKCGKPILWLPNNNSGKKAPVDADPVKWGGRVVIEASDTAAGGRHYRIVRKGEPTAPGTRHQMHMVTCKPAPAAAKPAEQPILPFVEEPARG